MDPDLEASLSSRLGASVAAAILGIDFGEVECPWCKAACSTSVSNKKEHG